MRNLRHLIERFCDRFEPLGATFVARGGTEISVGLPASRLMHLVQTVDGSSQWHLQGEGISVYVSSFGNDSFLILQMPFENELPPPLQTLFAFGRLAARMEYCTRHPDDLPDGFFPTASPVRRPHNPSPTHSSAARSLEIDD